MPEITMCYNKDCEKADRCYRSRAIPCEYGQSWSKFVPDKIGYCDMFISIKSGHRVLTIKGEK